MTWMNQQVMSLLTGFNVLTIHVLFGHVDCLERHAAGYHCFSVFN